jgi:glutathione peroxidase
MPGFHDFTLTAIDGRELPLAFFKDKAVLVVNVASQCGLTPQYTGLQELYENHKGEGLVVLGIPCNQFGAQEPGNEEEIQSFCTTRFNITFPMSAKIEVNGTSRHPLYNWLVGSGEDIQWNFEKFLIDREGNVTERFSPQTTPNDPAILASIEDCLSKS